LILRKLNKENEYEEEQKQFHYSNRSLLTKMKRYEESSILAIDKLYEFTMYMYWYM